MQISRHWRLNSQRYRLQGVRYENGEVSLQDRPEPLSLTEQRIVGQEIVALKQEEEPLPFRVRINGTRGRQ